MEEDPFADPFSSQTDSDERSADSRSPWGRREDSSTYGGGYGQQRDRQDDSYSGSREDSSIYGDDSSLQWGGRGSAYPDRSSVYGSQRKYGDQSSLPDMTYDGFTTGRAPTSRENNQMPGYYGRQQMNTRGAGTGWELDSGRRYDALPSTGWPQSTLPTPTDRQGWSSQDQTPGYTPYRNPYQTEDDGQRRYGDNFQPQQTEYSRPNNYQKWKDRNESWNPSSGNAYLDELMRDDRR